MQEIGLARSLRSIADNIFVFIADSNVNHVEEELIQEGITLIKCKAKRIGGHSRFDWDILLKYKIDIAHVAADNQLFVPSLLKYCDKKQIKAYCYIGTVESDSNNKLKRKVMDILFLNNVRCYRKHKCFAKTEQVRDCLLSKRVMDVDVACVGLDTSIIPSSTKNVDSLKKQYGIPEGKQVLLFVGRIDQYKRPIELIDFFHKMLKKNSDLYLVIIGTGSLDLEVQERIVAYGLQNNITWIKQIPNNEIHGFYRFADYYLNLNKKEIFGMGILEAMYQGCNVIAFHAPGPDTIIDNKTNGFLVSTFDEMETIIDSSQKVSSENAIKTVETKFTWDASAKLIREWINNNTCSKDAFG